MPLQHDNPEEAARAQRMTAGEAKAVIDLWQRERTEATGLTDRPAVPDVAEGLDVPVAEVQRLLAEVRAQRMKEEMRLAREEHLAEVQTRLAEEEARLADIQLQRAEVQRKNAERRGQAVSRRQGPEAEPVPWEVWKAAQSPMPKSEQRESSQVSGSVQVFVYGIIICVFCVFLYIMLR